MFALTGYVAGSKPDLSTAAYDLIYIFVFYVLCLIGGTSAYNSAFDEDDGKPVNYLDNPPPPPKYLAWFGFGIMLLAVIAGFYRSQLTGIAALAAMLFSIAYSTPLPIIKWKGKEIGIIDCCINSFGLGLISVVYGYSLIGQPMTPRVWIIGLAFSFSVIGTYPLTQLFQLKPTDTYSRARNYTTLLGAGRAIKLGSILRVCAGLTLIFFVVEPMSVPSSRTLLTAVSVACFAGLFLFGSRYMWQLSKHPFKKVGDIHLPLRKAVFIARFFWVFAEVMRWT